MARKKKEPVEHQDEVEKPDHMDEPLTSEMIEPEKPLEVIAESDIHKHKKFHKFSQGGDK